MAADFEKLSKTEYFKWKKDDQQWASFLAEIRTAILMTQRQTKTRAARTKELATSAQRDHLVNLMTTLEDLTDLEATATITYVTALKVGPSPDELAIVEAEEKASKDFDATTKECIKAATKIAKNVSERLEERAARGQRVSHRAHSQESLDGQHHSDPPSKIFMATELKPEQLTDSISQLELDDWLERAQAWADASNITKQPNNVQLGYLQAVCKPEMWILFKEHLETNFVIPADTNFEQGLEYLKETYYRKNDVFILKMKTAADTFKGKTFTELQTWFYKYRQAAKNCGLSTMTESEQYNFKLLTSMTEKMQKLLFVQNARPDLQETLDFIENQVTVESMTKAPTKVADTVNNVLDEPKKTDNIRCWDCHGRHRRSECTADKKSLYCKRCRVNGHSYEACRRGRRATRSPSQSGYTTRSSAPSPASTSSEETEQKEEKKKNKKKQRRSRKDNKSKEDTRQKRASSASASRSRSSSKRGKAGRTPKPKRKTRDTVNMIDESSDFSESQSSTKATRMAHLQQGQSPSSQLKVTLDTGS